MYRNNAFTVQVFPEFWLGSEYEFQCKDECKLQVTHISSWCIVTFSACSMNLASVGSESGMCLPRMLHPCQQVCGQLYIMLLWK